LNKGAVFFALGRAGAQFVESDANKGGA